LVNDITAPPAARSTHATTAAELAQYRVLLEDLRAPNVAVYALDIGASALLAWLAFALALWAPGGAIHFAAGLVAVLAAYRALAFIHELFHQHAMHGLRHFWHALVGVPLLLPLLLYLPIHQAHHSAKTYGTQEDGEYDNFAGRQGLMLLKLFLLNLALPIALPVRFGVLTPLAWLWPTVRSKVIPQFIHLALRVPFIAPPLGARYAREAARIEVACMLFVWLLAGVWVSGAHDAVVAWAVLLVAIGTLNTARAAVSTHLYVELKAGRGTMGQVEDSTNLVSRSALTWLLCPAGLQFHALHHMFPHLPYHHLRTAHQRLSAAMPANADYHHSTAQNLAQGLRRMLNAGSGKRPGRP
jgi:fatty acid desaturase